MAIRKFGNLWPLIKLGYGSIGERNLFIYGPVSKLTASLSQKFNLLFCLKSIMTSLKPRLLRQPLFKITHSVKAGIFIAIVAPATSQQRSAVGTLWA